MPDLAMCNSTVCPVRKNCERNWAAGVHTPDRDPVVQTWAGQPNNRTDTRSQDPFCQFYLKVNPTFVPEYPITRTSPTFKETVPFVMTPELHQQIVAYLVQLHLGNTVEEQLAHPVEYTPALKAAISEVEALKQAELSVVVDTRGHVRVGFTLLRDVEETKAA